MKKFNFLLTVIAITTSSLLTSCFSSSGELNPLNLPQFKGQPGTYISTKGTTYVTALCEVPGLSGQGVVPKEVAVALEDAGWGGILWTLEESSDPNLSVLTDPSSVSSHDFDARVIHAFCIPDGANFKGSEITFNIKTDKTYGMDVSCKLRGGTDDDDLAVTTDSKSIIVKVPHFCYWDFYMKGNLTVTRVDSVNSDTIHTFVNIGDNIIRYSSKFGYQTDETNAFAISYVKQILGTKTELSVSYPYYETESAGWLVYHICQRVATFVITSGSQTYEFKAYGEPIFVKDSFISYDHDGGSGSN